MFFLLVSAYRYDSAYIRLSFGNGKTEDSELLAKIPRLWSALNFMNINFTFYSSSKIF
jgi:hypothetical protein